MNGRAGPRIMRQRNKRSFSKRSSAAIIGGNDDLLTEILLFLPAKSLIRFKLVSKNWRSLISNQSFSHRHTLHHSQRRPEFEHSFILGYLESQFFVCDPTIRGLIPFRFGFPYVKILQSCNGLLLLRCSYTLTGQKEYYIFNPTTTQKRELNFPSWRCSGPCLIFDPSVSPHYKVVCVETCSGQAKFVVYHSETKQWNYGGEPFVEPLKLCNGFFFSDGVCPISSRNSSFDEAGIEFEMILDPPSIHYPGTKKRYIMESNRHLHYLMLRLKQSKNMLHVFEMKEVKCGWSKYRAFDFDPIPATSSGKKCTAIELIGMIRGEREDESVLLLHVPGKIMICRFSDKVFEVLVDFTREVYFVENRLQFGFKDTHPFVHSLALV